MAPHIDNSQQVTVTGLQIGWKSRQHLKKNYSVSKTFTEGGGNTILPGKCVLEFFKYTFWYYCVLTIMGLILVLLLLLHWAHITLHTVSMSNISR